MNYLQLNEILQNILQNEEDIGDHLAKTNVYSNNVVKKYSSNLLDVKDKIFIAQWCHNFEMIEYFIESLNLDEQSKSKYLKLKDNNEDIDETINFRILDKKYDFLNDISDMITTDIELQEQILSLDSHRLELLKILYLNLKTNVSYVIPYFESILLHLGQVVLSTHWKNSYHNYDSLIDDIEIEKLTIYDINILLYLFTTNISYDVNTYEELLSFADNNSLNSRITDKLYQEAINELDINKLKNILLINVYGISLLDAKDIIKKYDIEGLIFSRENIYVQEMYIAIKNIVLENNFNTLNKLYIKLKNECQFIRDFKQIIMFKYDLKKEFARNLLDSTFKLDNKPYKIIDGVKIYDAGYDFKMIITVLGAYQIDFSTKDNYSDYWNSHSIKNHGNCCSLIGNYNMAIAPVKNIILGFNSFDEDMFLIGSNKDLNSTPSAYKFNLFNINKYNEMYYSPQKLLENTRGKYNELVFERRDLSKKTKHYKKNPDYIVFIEEFSDIDKLIEENPNMPNLKKFKIEEDHRKLESLKAAKNFEIPIVIINRENIAINELKIIYDYLNEFLLTKESTLIEKIIIRIEANRSGNFNGHDYIREKYFSSTIIIDILSKIKFVINSEKDANKQSELISSYFTALQNESRIIQNNKNQRWLGQTPGIDLENEFKEIISKGKRI